MTDEVSNLVLEQLRLIRGRLDVLSADMQDMKLRMSSVEEHLGQQLIQFSAMNRRMDRFDERLGRIERRLELADA